MKKIVVSGGFDPVHVGHLELLQEAKKLGCMEAEVGIEPAQTDLQSAA